ncbi:hypothetical protein [Neptunicoccus cionae]|uniref:hypothetical protein n=1 Tax=Neptunicoccus cionae TaxID=2035344 RepID=UPI000C766E5B|nr:hypothetical protein [Amylibacter cionae]PLS21370.1 hypothetical protein C0U40_11265 [Amylibacter cionae]
MTSELRFYDSITDADADARGHIGISGSHGGLFAAACASRAGLRAVVLNDAGIGLHDAGIAGVRALADQGMAACAVDCMSAEIGAARDSFENGIVSYANPLAMSLGVHTGQSVNDAATLLAQAPEPTGVMAAVPESRNLIKVGDLEVLSVDSASLITPEDASRIIVTGSHGGLIGGNPARACKAAARFVSFSDAGIGKNDIGLSRLPALDIRGIAAVTLDRKTCEIGNSASALKTGIVSATNRTAEALGIKRGMPLIDAIHLLA